MLAAAIWDDLLDERWTCTRFEQACRKHRKLSSFLPTTADLIAADKAARDGAPYHEQVALPTWEIPADEQCRKNQVRAKELLASLANGVRPPWATRARTQ